MTDSALTLTPSRGLGVEIERYVETLKWAFAAQGVEYQPIDLRGAGIGASARILPWARGQLRASWAPTRVFVAHRALLPAAWLATTTGSLAEVLIELLGDPQRLAQMGRPAAKRARECFAPEWYATRAVRSPL